MMKGNPGVAPPQAGEPHKQVGFHIVGLEDLGFLPVYDCTQGGDYEGVEAEALVNYIHGKPRIAHMPR